VPRDDVRTGRLTDAHFAAQLDQIVRDPGAYPVYGDPEKFFELTFPTSGLKRLLSRVFGRLVGAKVEGGEHGVVRSETSFGGGKTHGLIAVYHLAKGARPSSLNEFIDPSLLPDECQIAAVVGDALDPVTGVETNGIKAHTIWGEIAAQLGPEAYAVLRENDEQRTAPGTATWRTAFGGRPTIVVIDELAAYLRVLVSSGNADVRRMAEAVPAFLKSLFELAAGDPNLTVVITLATAQNAFGKETSDLEQVMDETQGAIRARIEETQSITTRVGSIVKPAEDEEIGEILKRRLFESIDSGAAGKAGAAYAGLYQGLLDRGEQLSGGADKPVTYGEQLTRAYPFHPELIRVLDKRLGAIPNFQRARGSLRLLAEVVASIYSGDAPSPEVINLADIDISTADIRTALTSGLGRAEFDQVAVADFASPSSHAAAVDSTRFAGRPAYATRTARTVFLHSLEMTSQAGAGHNDWVLGTLATSDEPSVLGEALAELEKSAWYLAEESGGRWRFVTEEQPTKIVDTEARNVPNTAVAAATEDLIERVFASDAGVEAVHFPNTVGEVPDDPKLRLVVMHHDELTVTAADSIPPPTHLVEMLEKAGAGEGIRANRNALCFLVADADNRETMRERVRRTIAVEKIVDDSTRMAGFAEPVRKKLQGLANSAKLETRIAVTRCYKHLYYPKTDKTNGNLRHVELSPASQGDVGSASHTRKVVEALREEGKVRATPIATNFLRDKAWPAGDESISTKDVAGWFWRDHAAPILLDPTLLRDAIRDGVKNGEWVLYDTQAERAHTTGDPPPPIEITSEQLLYTPEAAEREGIAGRDPRLEDVVGALSSGPSVAGADLRKALEEATNREPRKGQVTELLARTAEGGDLAKAVVVIGKAEPGVKAATPPEIRKGPLDAMTILAPEEAQRLSILAPDRPAQIKAAEAQGSAGVAFQGIVDKVADSPAMGVKLLSIEAKADPGEGTRDIALLGKAISQLPRHDVTAAISVELDLDGLKPGIEIGLTGTASSYQNIEEALLALGKKATDFQGTLRLDIDFGKVGGTDTPEFEQVRKVITDLSPGEIRLKAVLE
jgi:hypothetical protein